MSHPPLPPSLIPHLAPEQLLRSARPDSAPRRLLIRLGLHTAAAGSAYVELGSTKVLAAVFGPRECDRAGTSFKEDARLEVEYRFAPGAVRRAGLPPVGGGGGWGASSFGDAPPPPGSAGAAAAISDEERRCCTVLVSSLSPAVRLAQYPKAVIEVCITVLQGDGGELDAAVIAGGLALAHAGVEMVDVPVSCSVGGGPGGRLLVDPDAGEASVCLFMTRAVLLPRLGRVTHSTHAGMVDAPAYSKALTAAMEGGAALWAGGVETALRESAQASAEVA